MAERIRKPYSELKGWLATNSISQKELAKSLDTTSNYINKKINGTGSDFKLSEVRKMSRDFGIPYRLFFTIDVPIKEQEKSA
ncbi:XRE family transcriptional regulator [Leuconostoc mesenteroides]|jgi:transcriptional regulator with XRE-family HTH domain|uniref:XRE family transcriptional regulator n=1 Tax=Leuconostoc TaxID=1243 RepID=UPI00273078AE|nr:XRE family transcriptional regulator [Leuconostoc mesenteroides]MCI2152429.1 helix-turn-helix domain-containing protein [Leuconostoc mesenteroides]MCI2167225.1 helix-turn-helix domain-containing protein [Leuconostoc mesenteroides]MDP0487089.1 XRE family transcriptional regulator [Leuconostoc mesenteroides]WMS39039.1 XRE family transcriptional regulator [Leuconostoc mesenteroides]